ncbi:hypothetical protein DL764_001268 [Monosporascus ibericus]|uniref:Transcription factor domain-containing protein n=1 Tax=Monosporascus ibericus TaxID=155417 RepID=A0A4V1XCE7_9PEZI|nr:hypothetical protein DL764_001268 [Monosporascus ibericus]
MVAARPFFSSPHPQSAPPPHDLNLADLELLHNFTTATYATLSENHILREFYRSTSVQLGLGCSYIMRVVLAVSGLHLAHYRPQKRDYYQALAITHHRIASRDAMGLMNEVTLETAHSLFLFSVFTIYFALASPRKEDRFLLVGESGFPDWMFLLQGTRTFIQVSGVPTEGPLTPVFSQGTERWQAREYAANENPVSLPGTPAVPSAAEQQLESLRDFISRREPDANLRLVYLKAITELNKTFSVFGHVSGSRTKPLDKTDLTDAFVWIFKGHWWMQGWPDHIIERCWSVLDEEHRPLIRWPIEEIGWIAPAAGT